MTIEESKAIDMIVYLSSAGYEPAKVKGDDYWYHSPFRDERTPSFKVNRRLNRWYDFGEGKGGSLIDFIGELDHIPVSAILQKLSFLNLPKVIPVAIANQHSAIEIVDTRPLTSRALIHYCENRRISFRIAHQHLTEVDYTNGGKSYYALGFKNDAGGYELRSPYFKGSSRPKSPTTIKCRSTELVVMEGCFDYLSYLTIYPEGDALERDFLILNSTTFFGPSIILMQSYYRVHLYLDNDPTGDKCTANVLGLNPQKFVDERPLYRGYKDLNDWHCHIGLGTSKNR